MSDKELDEILKEIKNRNSAADDVEPPKESVSAPSIDIPVDEAPVVDEAPLEPFNIVEEPEEKVEMSDVNLDDFATPADEDEPEEEPKKSNKKGLIIALAIVLILVIGAGVYFGLFIKKHEPESPTVTPAVTTEAETKKNEVVEVLNPLTGEPGYNSAALGKRPVAVVVENEYGTESVKPQWGMADADIVMEGETEYSTRMLFFWADYTNMPDQIGPTRSARPPFIRFSQLFNSVFIHAGLSRSKGNYVGADSVFESENVDHINLLSLSEGGTYFGRDKSRTSTIEHTGYLNGKNTAELLEKQNINTTLNESKFTQFTFNKEPQTLSENTADSAKFEWSNACPKRGRYTYNSEKGVYTTEDFDSRFGEANLEFANLLFLLDETDYVVKENYKGSGNSETYCNYRLSGGEGKLLSQGTYVDVTWKVENGKLVIKTADGNDVSLNRGKTYIGYGSSNHGGSIEINPAE